MTRTDPRLVPPDWHAHHDDATRRRWLIALTTVNVIAAIWYFGWLALPGRGGNPVLYVVLLAAELFNLVQAAGFWITTSAARPFRPPRPQRMGTDDDGGPSVDVFVPVYDEPVSIVEPVIAAARRIRGGDVRVWLLDDGRSAEMRALAGRHHVGYLTREDNAGAKAGNINAALRHVRGEYVVIFDCDHVPDARFLEATLGHFADPDLAYVQTPQYYANASSNAVAAASWSQQSLFFGPIARGKDALGAMFCCGTNVIFRRAALDDAGGFPTDSVTEDFQLSIGLHQRGWHSAYHPEVLASGLGPEDMASYVSQQQRWAQGCLGGMSAAVRARLPLRLTLQYLLSAMFFASGWTVLVYLCLPLIALTTGQLPIDAAGADRFLLHFIPYWTVAITTVAVASRGSYTFGAFAVLSATFWVHVQATVRVLTRRTGGFVVTPKEGSAEPQPRAVLPTMVVCAALVAAAVYGLARGVSPSSINNAAFALLHVVVLTAGMRPALSTAHHHPVDPSVADLRPEHLSTTSSTPPVGRQDEPVAVGAGPRGGGVGPQMRSDRS